MASASKKARQDKQNQKKQEATEFAALSHLCMRCPDAEKASKCPAAASTNLSDCVSKSDASGLWPGFQEFSETTMLDTSDHQECLNFLQQAHADHQTRFTDVKGKSKSLKDVFDKLKSERQSLTYTDGNGESPLTKDILDSAYNTVLATRAKEVEQELAKLALEKDKQNQKEVNIPRENTGVLEYAKKPQRADSSEQSGSLITNHFPITLSSKQTLFEYQITGLLSNIGKPLSSPKKNTIIRRLIENAPLFDQHKDSFAFNNEGKIIAWTSLTPAVPRGTIVVTGVNVDDYDRTSNGVPSGHFTLDVVFQKAFSFEGLDDYVKSLNSDYEEVGASQALDILFGNHIARNLNSKTVQIGDNRFFPTGDKQSEYDLGPKEGLIALRGFSSHISPVDGSVTLNVNTAFSAFYKQQTVQKYLDDLGDKKARERLLHARVRIMYDRTKSDEADKSKDTEARRTKTITGFSKKVAKDIKFTDRNNNEISVWYHFRTSYPAVNSTSQERICVNTGDTTPGQECWFLADQLEVLPGQIYRKLLDPNLTAKMIEFACQSPETNRKAILNSGLESLGLSNGTPTLLSQAGITFGPEMMKIPFHRIPSPSIKYSNSSAHIADGAWSTKGHKFYTTSKLIDGPVTFFVASRPQTDPSDYISEFERCLPLNGIDFKHGGGGAVRRGLEHVVEPTPGSFAKHIRNVGLAVLVLPDDTASERQKYAAFRVAADQLVGKLSIVLSEKRMIEQGSKLTPYMASNMMKINTRLGNVNHRVDAFGSMGDTLVLGADLVHPKQSNPADVPSIAALVGSIDKDFAAFYGSARRTGHRVEIIDARSMTDMAAERIRAWRDNTKDKSLPKKILYYRDGTGQSQYGDILKQEVSAIRQAFATVQSDKATHMNFQKTKVKITAVVVVKRHTTRFYPTNPSDSKLALKENCLPGTVVDSHITSPYYFDFYLQSHTIEKSMVAGKPKFGSAKPTHYFVIVDENKFSQKDLQTITNSFCYNFSHSTSPVSYASPAYLADRLCDRATLYLKRWFDNDEVVQNMSAGERQKEMDEDWGRGGQPGKNPWNVSLNSKCFWM